MSGRTTRHSFGDGDVIFAEGEVSNSAYLLVSGSVSIITGHRSQRQKTIAVLGKGEYFGEMGAIDNCPRSATAVAHGPVECVSVTPDEFMRTLLEKPQEAIHLLKVLFERLRQADRRIA
jgi:CRP/FNR family transcriptional regulator, cyclic AMP receptor protein